MRLLRERRTLRGRVDGNVPNQNSFVCLPRQYAHGSRRLAPDLPCTVQSSSSNPIKQLPDHAIVRWHSNADGGWLPSREDTAGGSFDVWFLNLGRTAPTLKARGPNRRFCFALAPPKSYFSGSLSDGVMVALGPLEASVMVRIHVGQPIFSLPQNKKRAPRRIKRCDFARLSNVAGLSCGRRMECS
jgi:hypothetical protein